MRAPHDQTIKELLFAYCTPSPCTKRGTVNFLQPWVFIGWPARAGSPLFSSVRQNCSSMEVGKSWLKFGRVASLENSRCGRKMDPSSSPFCKVLVSKHLTEMLKGSGTQTSFTNFVRRSLCTLPSYTPWQPIFAIPQISGCVQPSKLAHSASHLHVTADILPWAQRLSKAVASLLSCPFSRGLLVPLAFSFSRSTPLSLLGSFHTLSQRLLWQPFFKGFLYKGCFGNPFSKV